VKSEDLFFGGSLIRQHSHAHFLTPVAQHSCKKQSMSCGRVLLTWESLLARWLLPTQNTLGCGAIMEENWKLLQ